MTSPTLTTRIEAGTWMIDPTDWRIGFSVRELGLVTVNGEFTNFRGTFTLDDDGNPAIRVEIDIDSIATGNDRRDRDLRSGTFFDTGTYPTAIFVSTQAAAWDGDDDLGQTLTGDLTIKGITRPVMLTVAPISDLRLGRDLGDVDLRARTTVRRREFRVGPRSTLIIGDTVTVALSVRLQRT